MERKAEWLLGSSTVSGIAGQQQELLQGSMLETIVRKIIIPTRLSKIKD